MKLEHNMKLNSLKQLDVFNDSTDMLYSRIFCFNIGYALILISTKLTDIHNPQKIIVFNCFEKQNQNT